MITYITTKSISLHFANYFFINTKSISFSLSRQGCNKQSIKAFLQFEYLVCFHCPFFNSQLQFCAKDRSVETPTDVLQPVLSSANVSSHQCPRKTWHSSKKLRKTLKEWGEERDGKEEDKKMRVTQIKTLKQEVESELRRRETGPTETQRQTGTHRYLWHSVYAINRQAYIK